MQDRASLLTSAATGFVRLWTPALLILAKPRLDRDKRAMTFSALGDSAVVVALGAGIDAAQLPRVRALAAALERDRPAVIVEVVAAYTTVTVFYEPGRLEGDGATPYERVCRLIVARGRHLEADAKKNFSKPGRTVEIPVCYGDAFGPDLAEVARLGWKFWQTRRRHN